MSARSSSIPGQCSSFREFFSSTNMKSMVRGFVYEYETPKIVTIHSVSSKFKEKTLHIDCFFAISCNDVSFNSIINSYLRCCVFNGTQKRLSRNRHIDHIFDYTQS